MSQYVVRQRLGNKSLVKVPGSEASSDGGVKPTRRYAVNLLCGALAGGVATLVTHPPDVVRARNQLTFYSKTGAAVGGLASPSGMGARPIPPRMGFFIQPASPPHEP